MADLGDAESTLMLAQSVELMVGSDKFTLMREVEFEKEHPETRTDHGKKRVYGHAAPDVTLRAVISVSSDIFDDIKTYTTRNSNGVLPSNSWKFKATTVNGSSKTLSINGKMIYVRYLKADGPPTDPFDAEFRIRFSDEAVTIT